MTTTTYGYFEYSCYRFLQNRSLAVTNDFANVTIHKELPPSLLELGMNFVNGDILGDGMEVYAYDLFDVMIEIGVMVENNRSERCRIVNLAAANTCTDINIEGAGYKMNLAAITRICNKLLKSSGRSKKTDSFDAKYVSELRDIYSDLNEVDVAIRNFVVIPTNRTNQQVGETSCGWYLYVFMESNQLLLACGLCGPGKSNKRVTFKGILEHKRNDKHIMFNYLKYYPMPSSLKRESLVLVEEIFKRTFGLYYTTYNRSRETFIMPANCTTTVHHADKIIETNIFLILVNNYIE